MTFKSEKNIQDQLKGRLLKKSIKLVKVDQNSQRIKKKEKT